MKLLNCFILLAVLTVPGWGQTKDAKGEDHPFISRMPGYYIYDYQKKAYGAFHFPIEGQDHREVSGVYYKITYVLDEGQENPGKLGIITNYENAIKSADGEQLYRQYFSRYSAAKATLVAPFANDSLWIFVESGHYGRRYELYIVEVSALNQQVTVNPDYLQESIARAGKVAIYDILFDVNSSIIKPESANALQAVATLLDEQSDLKLFVVGHTDMDGEEGDNMTLSKERAQSVVQWLEEKHGVDSGRLIPRGVGPLSPVDTNETEEGKKRNRRVELVKFN